MHRIKQRLISPFRLVCIAALIVFIPALLSTQFRSNALASTAIGMAPTPVAQSAKGSHIFLPAIQSGRSQSPVTQGKALYFAGDNAWSGAGSKSVSDALMKDNEGPIQLGGDTVWNNASASEYDAYWKPTYGRIPKDRFHPAYGNHDANTPSQYASFWGAQSGASGKWWYSYDVNGQWHVVVLNSLTDTSASSPQVAWLKQDLAANSGKCLIGIYHEPRFSSGEHGDNTSQQALWATLADAGAEIVLNGHDHDYERFNTLDANGKPSRTGVREFVVGTGGIPEYNTNKHGANQAKFIMNEFGYLKLTLGNGTYAWQFISTAGGTVGDSGTGTCN